MIHPAQWLQRARVYQKQPGSQPGGKYNRTLYQERTSARVWRVSGGGSVFIPLAAKAAQRGAQGLQAQKHRGKIPGAGAAASLGGVPGVPDQMPGSIGKAPGGGPGAVSE